MKTELDALQSLKYRLKKVELGHIRHDAALARLDEQIEELHKRRWLAYLAVGACWAAGAVLFGLYMLVR